MTSLLDLSDERSVSRTTGAPTARHGRHCCARAKRRRTPSPPTSAICVEVAADHELGAGARQADVEHLPGPLGPLEPVDGQHDRRALQALEPEDVTVEDVLLGEEARPSTAATPARRRPPAAPGAGAGWSAGRAVRRPSRRAPLRRRRPRARPRPRPGGTARTSPAARRTRGRSPAPPTGCRRPGRCACVLRMFSVQDVRRDRDRRLGLPAEDPLRLGRGRRTPRRGRRRAGRPAARATTARRSPAPRRRRPRRTDRRGRGEAASSPSARGRSVS